MSRTSRPKLAAAATACLAACGLLLTSCNARESAASKPASAPSSPGPGVSQGAQTSHATTPAATTPAAATASAQPKDSPMDVSNYTEADWKKALTPEQYRILREKGTERAFTGKYTDTKTKGVYKCAACKQVLFTSDAKFDSHCGWPSFFTPLAKGNVVEHLDTSHGMVRTEVTCANCGGHLGHVFDDAPDQPTGLRYCINSVSIELVPADQAPEANAKRDTNPDAKK